MSSLDHLMKIARAGEDSYVARVAVAARHLRVGDLVGIGWLRLEREVVGQAFELGRTVVDACGHQVDDAFAAALDHAFDDH